MPLPPQGRGVGAPRGHPRKQPVEPRARQHLQGAEARDVEVELRTWPTAAELAGRIGQLRRQILLATGHQLQVAVDERPGVAELEPPRLVEQQVGRLHLPVQPTLGMERLEPLQ